MKLTISPRAAVDIEGIALHIAADSPQAAQKVLGTIERRLSQLVLQPFMGLARDDIGIGVRRVVIGQ